jgi:hypothetical protein
MPVKKSKLMKRKVKSAVKSKPVKRKVKSAVKSKPVKRKVKSAVKSKPVKRKVKSAVKSKLMKLSVKPSNLFIKKGYCEATILDENEPDDPCDIHKSENECISETKDTEYWRSYKCNWKN